MENISFEYLLAILALAGIIALLSFLSGKRVGASLEHGGRLSEEKKFQRDYSLLESQKLGLQRELEGLRQQSEKYLYFLVRLPEAVKQLNSNLSFDEIISSIIRLTKDLVTAEVIELYLFNKATLCLDLVAAFGSDKKKRVEVKLGEGIIGEAGQNRTMVFKEHLGKYLPGEQIEIGVPILYKSMLIGVIGTGKIKTDTGNEKRFIAMVADLAAVSLQNCEYLATAKEEAITDGLTGLRNKKYFLEHAVEAAQKALAYNFPLSIFIFDIDHFKKYNDQNGHVKGDVLLKALSKLVKENTRGIDTVARYGGEEFIVLLENTEKQNAVLYAEKIRKLIESHPFQHRETQPLGFVSISGGIATFPFDGNTIETSIKNADKALYISKESGRNRVAKYEPHIFSSKKEA